MELPKRKRTRLSGYDYSSQNYYFVTICVDNKKPLFGNKEGLNKLGEIAEKLLLDIPRHFEGVGIDKFVIMPDHIHAIIVIGCDYSDAERSRPFPTLSTIVGLYKSGVSKQILEVIPNEKIWQKSFNDRIIRNEEAYKEIWQYIDDNLLKINLD